MANKLLISLIISASFCHAMESEDLSPDVKKSILFMQEFNARRTYQKNRGQTSNLTVQEQKEYDAHDLVLTMRDITKKNQSIQEINDLINDGMPGVKMVYQDSLTVLHNEMKELKTKAKTLYEKLKK